MTEAITSKVLFDALLAKFPKAAILSEVTMEDESAGYAMRTYNVLTNPYTKKYYDKKGLDYGDVMPVGFDPNLSIPVRRIDALIFDWKIRTAVEIKISRSDFFRDTEAKRAPWMRHTHKFVYLTPKGLVKPEEVAKGCGLWEYQEDGKIVSVKNASTNKEVQDFPPSMTKYFAWRAFAAEQKLRKRQPR